MTGMKGDGRWLSVLFGGESIGKKWQKRSRNEAETKQKRSRNEAETKQKRSRNEAETKQ